MKHFFYCICILQLFFVELTAQDRQKFFAQTITKEDLKKHVEVLASDRMEGRETGTRGNDQAAKYISGQFALMGIKPQRATADYFQKVILTWHNWQTSGLQIGKRKYKMFWDYYGYPQFNKDTDSTSIDQIVFMGYGIDDHAYSDYKKWGKKQLKNKALIIFDGEPKQTNGKYRITQSDSTSKWTDSLILKLRVAQRYGAHTVFIVQNDFDKKIESWRKKLNREYLTFGPSEFDHLPNSYFISPSMAKTIFGNNEKKIKKRLKKIIKKGKSKPYALKTKILLGQKLKRRTLESQNVVGYLSGIDPKLNKECVVVSAHYDHLGVRGNNIYNGADDNASGSAAVLELAQAFKQAKNKGHGAKRSILFILMTGEEKGLLGSKYYTLNPIHPLDQTVANINIDMIGRRDKKHKDNPKYIYVIGANRISTELHKINEAMNANYTHIDLDYSYNAESDPNRFYYRSDHYNFAKQGVPSVFYFSGIHEDYHRPTDTIEKIEFEKMELITRLIFHTIWEIANRPERLNRDKWPPVKK